MLIAATLLVAGVGAGAFGALLGLGGGILLVPVLTLGFGVDFREAVAVSLLAVITTSSAGAAVYLRRGLADLRLGMTLELATAVGALLGGLIAFALDQRVLAGAFALMVAYVAISMLRAGRHAERAAAPDAGAPVAGAADPGAAAVPARTADDPLERHMRRLPLALALSLVAGVQSALLGVGGGTIKVPAMHLVLRVPLRVATATSNVMIGVTASASAVLYVLRGAVDPYVAGPILVGVFLGATAASRLSERVPLRVLRLLFVVVLAWVALQMALRALGLVT
ncbi:MAG TPA: sulfite exporter TauE/SafE family protein [Candidatus Limnocylindrales bacterium]|nr:sulfite exporter TauE/SafE family protein [Candidatus Limnocylindrales bacterium]